MIRSAADFCDYRHIPPDIQYTWQAVMDWLMAEISGMPNDDMPLLRTDTMPSNGNRSARSIAKGSDGG